MDDFCDAVRGGDLGKVKRQVRRDPGLVNAKDEFGSTALMLAAEEGHVKVIRCLLDKGAAINERCDMSGATALWFSCSGDGEDARTVRLLLERGADPTIADHLCRTPLMGASNWGHLKVLRMLLSHPTAAATINCPNGKGETALWLACERGREAVLRALLESGADPCIADNFGTTPMQIAKTGADSFFFEKYGVTAESAAMLRPSSRKGRRACVVVLEVSFSASVPSHPYTEGCCLCAWWQEAERAYQLWKARQVADQQGRGVVAVVGGDDEGEAREALLDFAVHGLKGNLFPDLMKFMG
jgi:uncharacterized protein